MSWMRAKEYLGIQRLILCSEAERSLILLSRLKRCQSWRSKNSANLVIQRLKIKQIEWLWETISIKRKFLQSRPSTGPIKLKKKMVTANIFGKRYPLAHRSTSRKNTGSRMPRWIKYWRKRSVKKSRQRSVPSRDCNRRLSWHLYLRPQAMRSFCSCTMWEESWNQALTSRYLLFLAILLVLVIDRYRRREVERRSGSSGKYEVIFYKDYFLWLTE